MGDTREVRYDFEPWNGTPGEAYDKWHVNLLNASTKTDDRGCSLADHILGDDEGGPAGPALPGGAGAAKAQASFRKRQKESYGIITRHITAKDVVETLTRAHFQDGFAAHAAVQALGQVPIDRLRQNELDDDWKEISILHDIGVSETTIPMLAQKIRTVNSKRPAALAYNETQQTERFLECIFTASKHFSEGALVEYQAPPGNRQFEHPPVPPAVAGLRNFTACEAHYAPLWRNAVRSRLPGFQTRQPQSRPSAPTRQTIEQGSMAMGLVGREAPLTAHDLANAADNAYVPRSGSPSNTLADFANAGDELASRRGTVTTTDWSMLSAEELQSLSNCGDCIGGECAYLFDADDQASVELLCDCCGGAGHLKRVCPSPSNKFRSHKYLIALHQAKVGAKDSRGPMRRPPGRGQRPPFRAYSKRFQPRKPLPGGNPRARSAEEGAWELRSLPDDGSLSSLSSGSDSASRASESALSTRTASTIPAERGGAATEGMQTERGDAATEAPPPFAFDTSDDTLFERCRIATERSALAEAKAAPTAPPSDRGNVGFDVPLRPIAEADEMRRAPISTFTVSVILVLLASIATAYEAISRNLGTLMVLTLILVSAPLARGERYERALAYDGKEADGHVSSGLRGLDVCVDSGCTTTSIPEEVAARYNFPMRVLETNPNRKLYIADNKGLDIVSVVSTELPVMGFKFDDSEEKPVSATLHISRALIVRGMKTNMILLSTRGMKRDAVNTYLNDDNSINRSDCLYITRPRIVVPFVPSTHSYNITIDDGGSDEASAAIALHPGSIRPASTIHTGLGHVGHRRIAASKLLMDGVELKHSEHDEATCKGCRLGATGKLFTKHSRSRLSAHGDAARGFDHFGQQMDSDICTGFPASFPHHFTAMVNFIDRYGHETFIYFLLSPNSHEIASAGHTLQSTVKHRLPDGKVGRWVTDNGKNFLGEECDEMARELCRDRGFQVPNDSDTLPVPERNWGVLQRMIRASLSHADAPQCLWTWGAAQANRLLYYLPTSALEPPQSPYEFNTGRHEPVDISWARTLYCDCTVTIADRDRDGKLGNRSADACHLGYDPRRGSHFCYVPSLKRLSSFLVSEWREDSFETCKMITADTPVEYMDARDLDIAPVTASMVPRRYTARAGTEIRPLRVVFVFGGTEENDTIPDVLRNLGHEVKVFDLAISSSHDLSRSAVQSIVKQDALKADFVFMSPPCDTASIAHDPPLRTVWAPTGRADLTGADRAKVADANVLYDFTGELAQACIDHNIPFLIESAASRRTGPTKCRWAKYADNGFVWDYPTITRLAPHSVYVCFAQCAFSCPWQKYTGILVDRATYPVANRIFGHADCTCASHSVVLQGYDESGTARTRRAQKYQPQLARAFATCIVEACGSNQEGERGDQWFDTLLSTSQCGLCEAIAKAATETDHHHFDFHVGTPLPVTKPVPSIHNRPKPALANERPPTDEEEIELWMESAEGAYRVSEIGSVPVPKTVAEAKASKWWPLFKKAMEEEIHGKLANKSWAVVKRPQGQHVLKSKWVFTIKYNDDGSIKVVKARFVGCGYSQVEQHDYDKVFAATLCAVAFRTLICCIAAENLETDHTDAVKAFTQADVDHVIYVEMPETFGHEGHVLLLYKALEGIKQGAYLWFQHNRAAWLKLGAKSWTNEPNLYWFPDLGIRVGVFADDTLSGYPKESEDQYKAIKKEYGKLIKIDSCELSPVLKFTGVQFDRNRADQTITIHMERYVDQLCEDYKGKFEESSLPYGESEKERKAFDNLGGEGHKADKGLYLQLMGKLVWPSSTVRLDITFAVNKLCARVSDPTTADYNHGLAIIGYLSTTRKLGITYGGSTRIPVGLKEMPPGLEESSGLYVVHDNSFGTCARPMGGFVVMYCNGAIDWSASNVKIVPDSSHEAESAQAARAAKAGIYARQLLVNNGRKVVGPTICFGDNKSNRTTSQQVGSTSRTRYYERAVLLFKRAVLLLILSPYLVGTHDMVADMFTKAVDKATFTRFRNTMMNVHGPLRAALQQSFKATTGPLRRLIGSVYGAVHGAAETMV